jgi:hypothetical protein
LGGLPEVAVEVALAPHATGGGREGKIAVGVVEVDLGFEHPGEVAGTGTTRPASCSPWSVLVPSRIAPSWAVCWTFSVSPSDRGGASSHERHAARNAPESPEKPRRTQFEKGADERLCNGKNPVFLGTLRNAPDENRTRDLRLERPTLFGPREGTVDH